MAGLSAGLDALETTGKIARFGIWAVMISVIPALCLYGLLLAGQLGGGFPSMTLYGLITLANAVFYLLLALSGIAVLVWIYRAHANLRDAGQEDLKFSPAWAVVSWFIPVINLFVPFTAMRALYNRSHGADYWNEEAAVEDVTSWWACHIVGILIMTFTTITFAINSIPGVWLTTPPAADTGLNIGAYVLMGLAAWFLLRIIRAITQAQRQGMNSAVVFE